jgi:hypothetical protein
VSDQGVFPGMERLFAPEWHPQPHIEAKLKNYLEGFAAHGRTIYARRKHIAAKLGIGVRTLARYLKHLTDAGWLQTVKRTARTAIRQLTESKEPRPFSGPSIKETPEDSQNLPKQNAFTAPSSGEEPYAEGAREKPLPLGYSEAFANYIGIFYAAGKAMNAHDVQRAHAAWIGIGPENWAPATKHALEQCQRTRHAQFVPLPVNHLLDRGWERVAPARTLPYVDTTVSRQDANQAEAARRFRLECEAKGLR